MSKRKPARTIKARSASKIRSKAAAAVSPRGERIRSRRGCWHCCADRAAPPSPPSRAPPAGSRTRCAPSWPPWCARSSGSGWSRRRRTASACIGLLPARLPATPRVCRVRSHAGALDKPGRDRGRDCSFAGSAHSCILGHQQTLLENPGTPARRLRMEDGRFAAQETVENR